ncbi:outer membrane lipoprotein carrier protein LolA [bacterium]
MKNIFLILITIPLLFCGSFCISFDTLLDKLDKRENEISTLSFNFFQEVNIISTDENSRLTGKVYYKKKNKFLIKNYKPFNQTIVTNGIKLWIYNPKDEQVIIRNASYLLENDNFLNFFDFIFDFEKFRKKYKFSFLLEEAAEYILGLKSADLGDIDISVYFDKEILFPNCVVLSSQDYRIITNIENAVFNKSISDTKFDFKGPKKVNIWNMEDK